MTTGKRPTGRPRQTFCKRGHLLADPNLYYLIVGKTQKYPSRACKACNKISQITRKAARLAKEAA